MQWVLAGLAPAAASVFLVYTDDVTMVDTPTVMLSLEFARSVSASEGS